MRTWFRAAVFGAREAVGDGCLLMEKKMSCLWWSPPSLAAERSGQFFVLSKRQASKTKYFRELQKHVPCASQNTCTKQYTPSPKKKKNVTHPAEPTPYQTLKSPRSQHTYAQQKRHTIVYGVRMHPRRKGEWISMGCDKRNT